MAYIEAIIAAIKLINQAVQGVTALVAWIEKNKTEAWFADSIKIFAAASKVVNTPATTDAEKKEKSEKLKEYSRGLSDLLSRV